MTQPGGGIAHFAILPAAFPPLARACLPCYGLSAGGRFGVRGFFSLGGRVRA